MFGKIDLLFFAVLTISLIATLTDLLFNKIFNWLTFPALIAGVAYSCIQFGWIGLGQSFAGVALGFLLYGWMFAVGWLGAGDVKLLMALGAWGGWHYTVEVAFLGILIGGCLSLGLLILKGRLGSFLYRMRAFLLSLFVKELEFHPLRVDASLRMPFGISIGLAAIWNLLAHPLSIFS